MTDQQEDLIATHDPENLWLSISIYVRGDDLDVAGVSRFTSLTPTDVRERGARKPSGRLLDALWSYSTDLTLTAARAALAALIGKLGPRFGEVWTLPGVERVYVDFCIINDLEPSGAAETFIEMPADLASYLAQNRISVQYTIYTSDNRPEPTAP